MLLLFIHNYILCYLDIDPEKYFDSVKLREIIRRRLPELKDKDKFMRFSDVAIFNIGKN